MTVNRKRRGRPIGVIVGSLLTVGALLGAARLAPAAEVGLLTRSCVDMAREVLTDVSFDVVYDTGADELVATIPDGRAYRIRASDPTCLNASPVVRNLINRVRSGWDRVVDGDCESVRELLKTGRTEVKGQKINRAAAERFVAACDRR